MLVKTAARKTLSEKNKTDWTGYYERPFWASRFTRALTTRLILRLLRRNGCRTGLAVCELGGGNSCFYDSFNQSLAVSRYTIVDSNQRGLDFFRNFHTVANADLHCRNLLESGVADLPADLVFSVGLIEHFTGSQQRLIVERHFEAVRAGGLVLITFPTPTFLYRFSRRVAELLGIWKFPDEVPMTVDQAIEVCGQYGHILERGILRSTIFTQGFLLFKADAAINAAHHHVEAYRTHHLPESSV